MSASASATTLNLVLYFDGDVSRPYRGSFLFLQEMFLDWIGSDSCFYRGGRLDLAVRIAFQAAGRLKYIHALGVAFLSRRDEFRFGR